MIKICSVKKCEEVHSAKGFCSKHYKRFLKYGDANYTKGTPHIKNRGCKIKGCDKKHEAKNLCHKHYGEQYRSKKKLNR